MCKTDKKFSLVGMMRVKNEEEWLEQSIRSQAPLVDRIVILDDGSTDRTGEICRSFPELVEYHYQDEPVIDEARDKNRLLEWVKQYDPDWVLALDGDEVLEDLAPETIIREIHLLDPSDPQFTVFSLHFLYFWNRPETYRIEPGIYSNFWQPRLFSMRAQPAELLTFAATEHGGNFHCGSIPKNLKRRLRKLDVKVKHYGYLWPEQRQRKQEWYIRQDPEQSALGYYDHLTSEEGMQLAVWEERSTAASASFVKDAVYFQYARPEILERVPQGAKRILDIGCGYGVLGREIKARSPETKVFGVEVEAAAVQAARAFLDDVRWGDIESGDLGYPDESFDCIILADVLEHLRDPWKVLLKVHRLLTPEGVVVISVPNVRNLGIIESLVDGNWRYVQAGILDSTHLRFFTLKEMQRMLALLGFEIVHTSGIPDLTLNQRTVPEEDQYRVMAANFTWEKLDRNLVQELHMVQFILQARKARVKERAKERSLTSIIIPVHNQQAVTKMCIDSIFTHTPEPFELIIIDNASDDATRTYLDSIDRTVVIHNENNEGFPRSCNQGLRQARGENIILLNNDVVLGEGWLGHLLDHLEDEPGVGLVGPCSNYVGPPQRVKRTYRSLEEYHIFVREHYWKNQKQYQPVQRLTGLCLLIRREVMETIGGLDERFGRGNFEDDDYCIRALMAGYRLVLAKDTYVHHFGSTTFLQNKEEYERLLAENWFKFKIKWQLDTKIQDRSEFSISALTNKQHPYHHYYLPLNQKEEEQKRQDFDRMFMQRQVSNQEACCLDYWEDHFCKEFALNSGMLRGKILDAGCGMGEIDIWLARAGYDITGVDLSSLAIQHALRYRRDEDETVRERLHFYQEPLERLPFDDEVFDTCIFFEVLEHISDPEPVIREISRVLKPDGVLLLTVPLEDFYKDDTHVHSFTPQSLEALLRQYSDNVAVQCNEEKHQLAAILSGIRK